MAEDKRKTPPPSSQGPVNVSTGDEFRTSPYGIIEDTLPEPESPSYSSMSGKPAKGGHIPQESECMGRAFQRGAVPEFVFDNGRERLRFHNGKAETVQGHQECSGFACYVMASTKNESVGVLPVRGNYRYAEVLARKRLEDLGDLTDESSLVIYQKRRGPDNEALVLYQIVPRTRHEALLRTQSLSAMGLAIFDIVALLRGVIMKLPGNKLHAVGFRQEGSLLLLVGKGRDIHLARRYALSGEGETGAGECLQTIRQDLKSLEKRNLGAVNRLCLIDPLLPENHDQEFSEVTYLENNLVLVRWPLEPVSLRGETWWSALPGVMRGLPLSASLGSRCERWILPLERKEKAIWAGILGGAMLFAVLALFLSQGNKDLLQQCKTLENQIAFLDAKAAEPVKSDSRSLAPYVSLAESLARARELPPLVRIWNRLAKAKPDEICLDSLSVRYEEEGVLVDMKARIPGNLARTQQLQIEFERNLQQAGFTPTNRALSLKNESEAGLSLGLHYTGEVE